MNVVIIWIIFVLGKAVFERVYLCVTAAGNFTV